MDNFTFLVAVVALMASASTIAVLWRRGGSTEGQILTNLQSHQKQLDEHDCDIHDLQEIKYLTEEAHEIICRRNFATLEKQIDQNDDGLKSLSTTLQTMETERHRAREVDNERWTKIETTLAAISEYIKSEKSKRCLVGHGE